MRIVKVKPTRGETGFRDRRLCRGLSRVRGNLPARFLGEGAKVTLLSYPTALGATGRSPLLAQNESNRIANPIAFWVSK